MNDPFATLGLPATMDLDAATLEARYLALSLETHPDRHAGADAAAQIEVLARAAALNDAYRLLRDPWSRARVLCERLAPGALDAHAKLGPDFLGEAMELAEDVARSEPAVWPELAARIDAGLAGYLARVRDALGRSDAARAACLLQEVRYWQKARSDLRARQSA